MNSVVRPARSPEWIVQRSSLVSRIGSAVLIFSGLALVAVPQLFDTNVVQQLTGLLILIILAAMWNALAGYAGLVSIGQQAFIGLGAYGTVVISQQGVEPYLAMILAAIASAPVAAILSLLVLRLRRGQFAVGTWVVAEAIALLIALDQGLGGGTGISLRGLNVYPRELRTAFTYWLTLGFAILLLLLIFLLLRNRSGVALQAIRDDEEAAASLGVRVGRLKFILFVLAGFGCGAAGALTVANTLFIQPESIFGVQWSAYLIFMVLVGGLGTFEGPIIGAILFFAIQYWFADLGAWYLIGLGLVAITFALFQPRGLWSLISDRFHIRLLPVGYYLYRTQSLTKPEGLVSD
jgi:branched-chain amino acid transport system permease protein